MGGIFFCPDKVGAPTGGTFLRGSIGVILPPATGDISCMYAITVCTDVLLRLFWYV